MQQNLTQKLCFPYNFVVYDTSLELNLTFINIEFVFANANPFCLFQIVSHKVLNLKVH